MHICERREWSAVVPAARPPSWRVMASRKRARAAQPLVSTAMMCSGWRLGRVSVPPRDGQLHAGHPLALLACMVLQLRPADLLRATRVRASCLQPLAAWHRHLPLLQSCWSACQQCVSTWRQSWSASSCGAGGASKHGLPRPEPSPLHRPAGLGCSGVARARPGGRTTHVP